MEFLKSISVKLTKMKMTLFRLLFYYNLLIHTIEFKQNLNEPDLHFAVICIKKTDFKGMKIEIQIVT